MRRQNGIGRALAAALLALAAGAGSASAAARLDYRGQALPARRAAALAGDALQAPGDSARVASFLERLVAELQGLGYLEARAWARWQGGERLEVEVAEGQRRRLTAVVVHAPAPRESALIAAALPLAAGDAASPAATTRALERALETLMDGGHPYAALGVRSWERDGEGVRLEVGGAAGPHVTVSGARLAGLRVTRPEVAERSLRAVRGVPYRRDLAEAGRERLSQLGLFRSVEFEGLEGEADGGRARLVYRVEEPRYHRFEGALGMQGEAGVVGVARLELGNLLGTGRALGLAWESRGRGVLELGARYAEPMILGLPLQLEGSFDQHVQDTLYVRTRLGARARLAIGARERLEAAYDEERVVQDRVAVAEARLRTWSLAVERATLDRPLAPRRGVRVRLGASQTAKSERLRPAGSAAARAGGLEVESAWHRPLSGPAGLALELSARGRFSSERVLPLFERLPLGGARSLRGYDEEQFRVDRYALARLEWRWFLGGDGQRLALFWDHAHAVTRVAREEGGDRLETLGRDGFGFGLRLAGGGSLIGLDYGLAPGRAPLEGKVHLQIVSTF